MRSRVVGLSLIAQLLWGCGAPESSGIPPIPAPFPPSGPLLVPQQYATIQGALASASAGDTIRVAAGTYQGPVGVGLPVVLEPQGNGPVVIQEGPSGSTSFAMVLTPSSSGATVRGFTLRGTRSVLTGSPANTGRKTRLENLLIEGAGNSTCINLSDSHDLEIVNSVLRVSFGGIAVGSVAPSRRTLLGNLTLHLDPTSAVGLLGIAVNQGSQLTLQNITLDSQNPAQSFVGPVQGFTVRQSSSDPANPFSSILIDGFRLQIPLATDFVAALLLSEISDFVARNLVVDIGPTPNLVTAPRVGVGIFASSTRQNNIRLENMQMRFAALDPGTASNGSIGVGVSSVGNLSVSNSTVSNGDFGILMSDASNITVRDSAVSNVTQFAFAANGINPGDTIVNGEFTRCRAQNSFIGVLTNSTTVPDLLVRNCLLTRNSIGCGAAAGTTRLLNNVVGGNQLGVLGLANVNARNNQIFANDESIQGAVVEDFNNFFANVGGDGFSGANSRSQDPLFLDIINFLLAPNSPSIDAGDPDPSLQDRQPPGLGGLRNDIGAYGGPAAANPLGPQP